MTKQPKWTPGPWRVGSRGGSSSAVETADGRYILADLTEVDGEENARLIAAAPDLYDALEYTASLLRDWCRDQSTETGWKSDELAEQWMKAQAALAKARGEQS